MQFIKIKIRLFQFYALNVKKKKSYKIFFVKTVAWKVFPKDWSPHSHNELWNNVYNLRLTRLFMYCFHCSKMSYDFPALQVDEIVEFLRSNCNIQIDTTDFTKPDVSGLHQLRRKVKACNQCNCRELNYLTCLTCPGSRCLGFISPSDSS